MSKTREIALHIKCYFDPETRELKCILTDKQWDEIEKMGGIHGIRIVRKEPGEESS